MLTYFSRIKSEQLDLDIWDPGVHRNLKTQKRVIVGKFV